MALCLFMKKVLIKKVGYGFGVLANEFILKGDVILNFERNFINFSTNKTLRINDCSYQVSTNPKLPENFINHSCEPNACIDFEELSLVALKDIPINQEITYNYFTSDWDKEDVFECYCSSIICKKKISGFKYLSIQQKNEIKEFLSPFLKSKLIEKS
jgi:hypothetical protein